MLSSLPLTISWLVSECCEVVNMMKIFHKDSAWLDSCLKEVETTTFINLVSQKLQVIHLNLWTGS